MVSPFLFRFLPQKNIIFAITAGSSSFYFFELVAARGVAREAKKEILQGNSIVFSASSGDETAMTYKEKAVTWTKSRIIRVEKTLSGQKVG